LLSKGGDTVKKKLARPMLNRETLVHLNPQELGGPAGGLATIGINCTTNTSGKQQTCGTCGGVCTSELC
jgi:hypothetical protein